MSPFCQHHTPLIIMSSLLRYNFNFFDLCWFFASVLYCTRGWLRNDLRGKDSLQSESNQVLHVGAHTEYNGKDEESQPKPRFLDVYRKEESVQVEEGVFLEDRELPMSVLVDIAHEQSRDTAFREAGYVPLPSQIYAIAKGRKNKNKRYDGGVEPAAAQSSHQLPDLLTPGTMPEVETSYNVNSDPLDPGLAAQVATM